jgi:hypothetical protein
VPDAPTGAVVGDVSDHKPTFVIKSGDGTVDLRELRERHRAEVEQARRMERDACRGIQCTGDVSHGR